MEPSLESDLEISVQNESNLLTQHLHSLYMRLWSYISRVTIPVANRASLVLGKHSETISKSQKLYRRNGRINLETVIGAGAAAQWGCNS